MHTQHYLHRPGVDHEQEHISRLAWRMSAKFVEHYALVSPDGRRIAFARGQIDSSVWMVTGF